MRAIVLAFLLLFTLPLCLSAADEEKKEAPAPIIYYQIKPSLVANLASGGKYIRCDIQLMTNDESLLADLRLHDPAIRHTLLLLLSDQDGNKIKTPEGKEALRREALNQVSAVIKKETGKESIKALFFTTFFVQ
jgi:flagellar protein FliL